jgi:hypothetical protein
MTIRSLSALDLPPGVTIAINQLTQQAKSLEPGTYTFTVRVADSHGTVGRRNIDVTISAPAATTNPHSIN